MKPEKLLYVNSWCSPPKIKLPFKGRMKKYLFFTRPFVYLLKNSIPSLGVEQKSKKNGSENRI